MASGLLYSNVRPNTIQPTWLQMMETDRERRNIAHSREQERRDKERAELFDGIKDVDAEGAFLEQSVEVTNQIRKHLVDQWKRKEAGEISESDFLVEKARLESAPDQITAAYQAHDAKLNELAKGDSKLNYHELNGMTQFGANSKLEFDPEKGVMVNSRYTDRNGVSVEVKYGVNEHIGNVNAISVIPDQGDPNAVALKFGNDFKADEIQKGRHTTKGLDTGESLARFNTSFEGSFGARDAKNNYLVRKYMVSDDPNLDTYEEAWDTLNRIAKSSVAEIDKTTPTPQRSTAETKTLIQKNKITNLSKSGKGDVTLTEVTPLGSKSPVSGRGATFDVSSTDKTIEVTASDIAGVDEGSSEKIKVNAFFIDEGGDVYIKGSTKKKSAIERAMAKEDVSPEEWMKEGTQYEDLDWVKIQGTSLDNLRTNLLGTSTKEALQYLKDNSKGLDKETTESKPTAQELIAKYSK